ncbi:Rv3654c family TadE-like protein [Dactylosporangium cerinum]|uniref:Rv3654c family TadE-like protein n=1 Tax=Dactylosporangium cerinum TaxID=1434730 RepID=A0ABV9VY22_9ACTN
MAATPTAALAGVVVSTQAAPDGVAVSATAALDGVALAATPMAVLAGVAMSPMAAPDGLALVVTPMAVLAGAAMSPDGVAFGGDVDGCAGGCGVGDDANGCARGVVTAAPAGVALVASARAAPAGAVLVASAGAVPAGSPSVAAARARPPGRDRGSISLLMVVVGVVFVAALVVGIGLGGARVARHRAQNAADAGALAAAVWAVDGSAVACPVAGRVVSANDARLVSCTVDGLDVRVTVEVRLSDTTPAGRATARAGPVRDASVAADRDG